MSNKLHHYAVRISWKDELGTTAYSSYTRDHLIKGKGKANIEASSDPAFRGNASRYNPEELFLSAISNCHMLWYLHLCAVNGIVVTSYEDEAKGIMQENEDGSGQFTEVILNPVVNVLSKDMIVRAETLHSEANKFCFIANSLNFAVTHYSKTIAH